MRSFPVCCCGLLHNTAPPLPSRGDLTQAPMPLWHFGVTLFDDKRKSYISARLSRIKSRTFPLWRLIFQGIDSAHHTLLCLKCRGAVMCSFDCLDRESKNYLSITVTEISSRIFIPITYVLFYCDIYIYARVCVFACAVIGSWLVGLVQQREQEGGHSHSISFL